MKPIQQRELERAIKFIDSLGCAYKIITPEGTAEYGALEVKPVKERTRAPLRYPYGEMSRFYRPQINLSSEIGEVQEIQIGKFSTEDIRAGVCSVLSKEWGNDTYTTSMGDGVVEVLRTA